MFDWGDLRHFLAVAEAGSTLAAARRLRVSQTTAARRIDALEAALGLALFERRQSGYRLTPAGEALLERARAVAAAAAAFDEAAQAQGREASGTVRITAADVYATALITPALSALHARYPDLRIELDTSEALRDLGSGEADVALRSCVRPEGAGVVGRRIADNAWTIYCSRAYAETHGHPRRRSELAGHVLVGGGEDKVWRMYEAWLTANGLSDQVTTVHRSSSGLMAAVRAGVGLAALPCLIADRDPGLLRCLPPIRNDPSGLWLLTHERVRRAPPVRAVLEFLAAQLAETTRPIAAGLPEADAPG